MSYAIPIGMLVVAGLVISTANPDKSIKGDNNKHVKKHPNEKPHASRQHVIRQHGLPERNPARILPHKKSAWIGYLNGPPPDRGLEFWNRANDNRGDFKVPRFF